MGNVVLFGPTIETKLWPVYGKFVINTITPDGDGVIATFKFTKLRLCRSLGISWVNGELGQRVDIEVLASTENVPRPLGEQITRPYRLPVSETDLRKTLSASITSQCDGIPWRTTSEVYP